MQTIKENGHRQSYPVVNSLSYKSDQHGKICPWWNSVMNVMEGNQLLSDLD